MVAVYYGTTTPTILREKIGSHLNYSLFTSKRNIFYRHPEFPTACLFTDIFLWADNS
jgi:hypothetical protein